MRGEPSVPDRCMTDLLAGPLQVRCASTGCTTLQRRVGRGRWGGKRVLARVRHPVDGGGRGKPPLGVTGRLQQPRTRFRHGAE